MEFTVLGSIVRIKMIDFMQYKEVEFHPGPNLNVILGPNGSGKSTIVNGICLAVGGKTGFLGRATNIIDFIRLESNEAIVELELFNNVGSNYIIKRQWSRDGKTKWYLNGGNSNSKEIESLVKRLQIQVGNLCQFLPQDKVHDFSKMNSKVLLNSTIEAVGEKRLKDRHEELKKLQNTSKVNSERFESKIELCNLYKNKLGALETDVQNFKEKKKIDEQIEGLEKRKLWIHYFEQRTIVDDLRKLESEAQIQIQIEKDKMKPLENEKMILEIRKEKLVTSIKRLLNQLREATEDCKDKSSHIENLEKELVIIEDQLAEIEERVVTQQNKIKSLKQEISDLEMSINDVVSEKRDNREEEMIISELKNSLREIHGAEAKIRQNISDLMEEKDKMEKKKNSVTEEIESLQDAEAHKIQRLNDNLPQGADAVRALKYLRQHKSELNFNGRIYDPLLLTLEIIHPSDALYIENCVPVKDLVAFAAEDAEDANKLINLFRQELHLKVNVIQTHNVSPKAFQPTVSPSTFKSQMSFKGYLKDMIKGPDAIVSYLCKLYGLHNTAAFDKNADTYLEELVENIELKVFFVDNVRYSVTKSKYSGQKSTSSAFVKSKQWLKESFDAGRIQELKNVLEDKQKSISSILDNVKESHTELKNIQREKVEKSNELKKAQSRENYVKSLSVKLDTKRSALKEFLNKSSSESLAAKTKKDKLVSQKYHLVSQILQGSEKLCSVIRSSSELKIQLELEKLKEFPIHEHCETITHQIQDAEKNLRVIIVNYENRSKDVEEALKDLQVKYKAAQSRDAFSSSLSTPPSSLSSKDLENPSQFPHELDEIESLIDDLKAQSNCLGTVDLNIIQEYTRLKASIIELENDIEIQRNETAQIVENIETLRTDWINDLTSLIERITQKFSSYFDHMGYAGQVKLVEGDFPNDFENYGIHILVKYRAIAPLCKLDPHLQSGGERSVATACYMMALQGLTPVPFRCVDEINQGMDATNERSIFDLLVNTTSSTEDKAQYFLLTPKLLPNLTYNSKMVVLIVNNGPFMCHYSQWNSVYTL